MEGSLSTGRSESEIYRIGRKLVGDRTAKVRLQVVKIFESTFADDIAVCMRPQERHWRKWPWSLSEQIKTGASE